MAARTTTPRIVAVSPISRTAPAGVRTRRTLILCALLAAAALALYSPVGKHPFIEYDDPDYVVGNKQIHDGVTWTEIVWSLTSVDASNWHPVTWLSHAIDCQLFGLDASGHHWTSAVIHAINAVLLFLLLVSVTKATWRSLLVAALFALHPLNVESVAWIAERKNVLSTLFFLLALGAYGWYARRPGVRRYLTLLALFVLGLASKPMVITLPFVLLLLDVWPLQRIKDWTQPSANFPVRQETFGRLLWEKLPLLACSAGSAVITIIAQKSAAIPSAVLPLSVRIEDAIYAYGMYLWKAIWPAHLALIYPHPGRTLAAWQPLLAAAVLVALSVIAWRQRSRRPYLLIGWLWFLGTAVPIIGILQVGVQVIADRYAYLTLIGILVMLVWAAGSLADDRKLPVWPRAAVSAVILAALSVATWRQVGYWRSTFDVWTHALAVTKDNSIAENNLSGELFRQGRYQEGIVHLRIYGRLEPLDPSAHARLGADAQDHGRFDEAAREYETALRAVEVLRRAGATQGISVPMTAMTYANLAIVYMHVGDNTRARESMRKGMQIDPQAIDEMLGHLFEAVGARPSAQGYVQLGLLLGLIDHPAEARQAFAQALRFDPKLVLPPLNGLTVQR